MGLTDILSAFLPLLIIVALLYGVMLLIKKYGGNFRGNEFSPINIKIVNTKMIMPKRFISVVKIEDKLLVLGVSEHSVNLIKELDYDASLIPETGNAGKENFIDVFKKNFRMR